MENSIKDKLLSCRSYEDARPILETHNAGVAVHKLFSTGFGVQAKQPTVARDFFNTAIQEMEDDELIKKVEEIDGGSSEQSSSTTGLEKIGAEHSAPESASVQPDKKDQMGVAINESFPGQPGMMPPQQQPPLQQTHGMGGCGGAAMPPQQMNPQQQMQMTVNETVRQALVPITEAIKKLDKKIQETQKVEPNSLDLGSSMGHKKPLAMIKETTGDSTKDLASTRNEIKRMNDMLNSGKY